MARTVLIVDDHKDFRAFARRLLEWGGFDVVGEAEDSTSALRAAGHLHPQLIVLDIGLPDGSGVDIVPQLREMAGHPTVVLVSSRNAEDYGPKIEQSGAHGFIPKADFTAASVLALLEPRR